MPDKVIIEAKSKMEAAYNYLLSEYSKLQTGRANPALVENLMVESFGTMMPLKGLASISIPETTQIAIQPWNRDSLVNIEKAIANANLGLNPQNNGTLIRIQLPPLTEERRKDLVKLVYKYAEDAKISVRNARHDGLGRLKSMEKNKEISEDLLSSKEKEFQKTVDDYNTKIEESSKKKEKDIMTV
jgi:ribosome recycling factor